MPHTAGLRLITDVGLVLHAPAVVIEPDALQRVRRDLVRAIADAEEITSAPARRSILRALLMIASEVGCAVCGGSITLRELEECETRRSLVHLWGSCSDRLADILGASPDDVLDGRCW